MSVEINLTGDLPTLLRRKWKLRNSITLSCDRRASVKDVLESLGLPHTEIGSITVGDREADFNWIVEDNSTCTVSPVMQPFDVTTPTTLRPETLAEVSFIADVNVGRLARYLRAAGINTLYDHRWRDEYISDLMTREKRILLTRDLRLLMRKHIHFGRYVRATRPEEQLQEVISLFGLSEKLVPFSRCLDCNSILEEVTKQEVLHRLEPLTKKYYWNFSICIHCDKIYWPGSHIEKMQWLFTDFQES